MPGRRTSRKSVGAKKRSPRLRGSADGARIAPGAEAGIPLHRSDVCAVARAYRDVAHRRRNVDDADIGQAGEGADDHLSTPVSTGTSLGETGLIVKTIVLAGLGVGSGG